MLCFAPSSSAKGQIDGQASNAWTTAPMWPDGRRSTFCTLCSRLFLFGHCTQGDRVRSLIGFATRTPSCVMQSLRLRPRQVGNPYTWLAAVHESGSGTQRPCRVALKSGVVRKLTVYPIHSATHLRSLRSAWSGQSISVSASPPAICGKDGLRPSSVSHSAMTCFACSNARRNDVSRRSARLK